MPTLRQLEYLVALADERHFVNAAERCNTSQPTLSMQVKQLEERLGRPLLERRRKDLLLTPFGEQVVSIARNMLLEKKAILQLSKRSEEVLEGELVLGVIPTMAPYYLPFILPHIKKSYPKLELYLKEEQTPVLLEKLQTGEVDVALMALPVEADHLESLEICQEEFVVALPIGHKLSALPHITVEQIVTEPLMLLEEGHCLRDQALEVCHRVSHSLKGVDFRATSLETLKQMVANGLGVTLLPQKAAHEGEGYVIKPFKAPVPVRKAGLVWRRSTTRREDFKALAACIEKVV